MNPLPPPQEAPRDPDPDIRILHICPSCHGAMGSLRVNEGTSHLSSRGMLCQTCRFCYASKSHTPAYVYSDAEHLLVRINTRLANQPTPLESLYAPLRYAPTLPEVNGPGPCNEPGCQTATGTRRQANSRCIEHLCKPCCANAALTAESANIARDYCKIHKVNKVAGPAHYQPPPVPPPALPPPLAAIPPPPPPNVPLQQLVPPQLSQPRPVTGPSRAQPPSIQQVHVSPQRPLHAAAPPPSPASSQPLLPPQSQPRPIAGSSRLQLPPQQAQPFIPPAPSSSSSQPRRPAHAQPRARSLAQPMSQTWANKRLEENSGFQATQPETNKTTRQRLDVAQEAMAELVIYFKADQLPLQLQVPVAAYPRTSLSDHADLMRDLQLSNSSWLDIYQGSEWKTLQASTTIEVSKHCPVLVRLRPSLLEDIPLLQCPNVDRFLIQQPRKRTGSTLVSPIKKIAHTSSTPTPTSARASPFLPVAPMAPAPPSMEPTVEPAAAPIIPQLDVPTLAASSSSDGLKRFPDSFTVAEHDRAWQRFEDQQIRARLGMGKMWPELFPGSHFVKTTANTWRGFFNGAPRAIRDHFVCLGNAGCWADFKTAVVTHTKTGQYPQFLRVAPLAPLPMPPSIPPPLPPSPPILAASNGSSAASTPSSADLQTEIQLRSTPSDSPYGLCDFCDAPYKVEPSAKLLRIRSQLFLISTLSPNFYNPVHRTLQSSTRLAAYCQQHETDAARMPLARANNWPEHINYAKLFEHGDLLVSMLQETLEDLESSSFFLDACDEKQFVKKTGYFGNIGYKAIERFIRDKFPLATIQNNFTPLTYDQLIEVFVAEALSFFIVEDFKVDEDTALVILEESTPFGLAYHSDTDDRDRSAAKFHEEAPRPHDLPILSPLGSPVPSAPHLPQLRETSPSPPPIDPTTLCAFCDQPLPADSSRRLLAMGKKLLSSSWPDPLPDNPLHRKLPTMSLAAAYCARHRFEHTELQTALLQGWPSDPDFQHLFQRVLNLATCLRGIIHKYLDSNEFFLAARAHYGQQISQRSTLKAKYANNRECKHGTGYYGECGYQIIYPTLCFLFPDLPDLLSVCQPLTYDILIREVLIPEATVRLIQADLEVDHTRAVAILHESYQFGLGLHQADDDCPFYSQAMMCIAESNIHPNCSFEEYYNSDSELPFNMWLRDQRGEAVKREPAEATIPRITGTCEVIDLTSEDDERGRRELKPS